MKPLEVLTLSTVCPRMIHLLAGEQTEEGSDAYKFTTLLSLTANVLRDSEVVDDLHLKESGVGVVVRGAANLITELELDEEFQEFIQIVIDRIHQLDHLLETQQRQFDSAFRWLPAYFSSGVLKGDLKTVKLRGAAQKALLAFTEADDPIALGLCVAFAAAVGVEGFGRYLKPLLRHWDVPFIGWILMAELRYQYVTGRIAGKDAADVFDFVQGLHVKFCAVLDAATENRVPAAVSEEMRRLSVENSVRALDDDLGVL